jgi:histone acetyltransferase (RNA polymerase elongator complex component)
MASPISATAKAAGTLPGSERPLIIPVFIPHAGCPHRCVFCNQSAITGTSPAVPDRAEIFRQVEKFLSFSRQRTGRIQIAFYGGNFLGLMDGRATSLLEAAADCVTRRRVDTLRFSTRPDTVTAANLERISPYPIATVELGVQSMDDRVLEKSGRGHTASDTVRAVDRLRRLGFEVGIQMMVGLPGQDRSSALASARAIAALTPDFVRIYPTVVISGSRLARWFHEGRYEAMSLETCIREVKEILEIFGEKEIPVIRVGLQASRDLEDPETVLAGPYHPALGHIIYSEIFYDRAAALIATSPAVGGTPVLTVHPRSLSRMQGLRNRNRDRLISRFGLKGISIRTDAALGRNQVEIAWEPD